jgi:hypothetical protein
MERRRMSCGPDLETFTRRSVIVEKTTTTIPLEHAVPTANFHTAVMVSKILVKPVTKEGETQTHPTLADPTVFFHSVVMELLIASMVKLVMMETTDLVMVAMPTANLSAEMEYVMQMRNATMDHTTLTPRPMNAEPTASSSCVVMVLLTLVRNATLDLPTATLLLMVAELLANSQFAVTE